MTTQTVHILPSRSAAGSAKLALKALGKVDRVVGISDHLGYGPIAGDLATRRSWLDAHLGEGYGESADLAELDWQEALAPNAYPIIWTCRSDAGDYAGYLEFLARIGDRSFDFIDATGLMIEGAAKRWRAPALGVIAPNEMISSGMFERQRRPTAEAIADGRAVWLRLETENAPLRVCEDDRLLSKPIYFYDSELLDEITEDWERGVRIVGNAMARLVCAGRHVADSFIWSRYLAFADKGLLEIECEDGEIGDMRLCRLRRAVT